MCLALGPAWSCKVCFAAIWRTSPHHPIPSHVPSGNVFFTVSLIFRPPPLPLLSPSHPGPTLRLTVPHPFSRAYWLGKSVAVQPRCGGRADIVHVRARDMRPLCTIGARSGARPGADRVHAPVQCVRVQCRARAPSAVTIGSLGPARGCAVRAGLPGVSQALSVGPRERPESRQAFQLQIQVHWGEGGDGLAA